eukprot:6194506-Pleurochrysis_carterae.AAC.1
MTNISPYGRSSDVRSMRALAYHLHNINGTMPRECERSDAARAPRYVEQLIKYIGPRDAKRRPIKRKQTS